MFKKSTYISFIKFMAICTMAICVNSCKQRSLTDMIVMSQIKGDIESADYLTGDKWRYMAQSRIVALNTNAPNETFQELTKDFYSACSPRISYDGSFMLFAAQKNQNDNWQIWEMNLTSHKKRQITSSKEDCVDPDYLPGERLVFSKMTTRNNPETNTEYTLFTCNLDGSNIAQITYDPSTYIASTVLNDGRVVAIGKELIPEEKDGRYMIMRPDGTKKELFYQTTASYHLHSRVWETGNGKIVFIESDSIDNKGITSIEYNRPLHSKDKLTSKIVGDFYSISPYQASKLLTSYRPNKEENYAIYEFNTKNLELAHPIYKDKDYHILEAVAVEKRERPRKLPSEVDLNVKTALLVCQDIGFTNTEDKMLNLTEQGATRFEVLGIDSSLGIWDAEDDGSFYLEVPADTPFRIQTIDDNDNVISDPGSWLYLRPNERRGCVGCHQNNEMAPKNRQPLAVRKEPIQVISITNVLDQKKELKE